MVNIAVNEKVMERLEKYMIKKGIDSYSSGIDELLDDLEYYQEGNIE
jgi:hypothetical protein